MLQLLLTEAIRHAHYTSDTIKIHLKYGGLIKRHRTLGKGGVSARGQAGLKGEKILTNIFPPASKEKIFFFGLTPSANRKKGSGGQ